MNPKDVFGVAVRIIGLLLLVSWVPAVIAALFFKSGLMMFGSFMTFAIGAYLLRGAPLLLERAYPTRKARAQEIVSVPA